MKTNASKGATFTQDNFTGAFIEDLDNAKGVVLIVSPFLRMRRLSNLHAALTRCVERGVRVCVLAQEVDRPTDGDLQEIEESAQLLRGVGIHVTFIARLHVKLALIDEDIIWDGSLNILSVHNTKERMTRWVDRDMVLEAQAQHEFLDACEPCKKRTGVAQTTLPKAIGRDLSSRRKRIGLNQTQLAEISQQKQSVISLIESGSTNATLETLNKICEPLGCELRVVPKFLASAVDALLSRSIPRDKSED